MSDDKEMLDWRAILQKVKKQRNLSNLGWAKMAGIGESTIRNFLKGTSSTLQMTTIERLAQAIGLSVQEMIALGNVAISSKNKKESSFSETENAMPAVQTIAIDELNVRVSAGDGAVNDEHEAAIAQWLVPINAIRGYTKSPLEYMKIVTVIGDSMSPDFDHGEKVIVDTFDRAPSPPGVFIIWDGIANIIKRLEYWHDEDGPKIELISKNTDHKRRLVPAAEVTIQGRVIRKWPSKE